MSQRKVLLPPAVQAALKLMGEAGISCAIAYVQGENDDIVTCGGGADPELWYPIAAVMSIAIDRNHAVTPGFCSACGCSESVACTHNGEPCSWANAEQTLCSRCSEILGDFRKQAAQAVREARAKHAHNN